MTSGSRIQPDLRSGALSPALTVVLDIRYPQAYLALHPAMAFARERGIEIDWWPVSVSTLKPPTVESEGEARGVRHRRLRTHHIAHEIEVYGEIQGLVLRDFYRTGDSSAFNLGWLWMRNRQPKRLEDYLVEAFRSYWAVEFDPAIEAEVASLIDSLDGQGEAFRSWAREEGPVALASMVDEVRARGVFAVPSYLVEGEVFLGRQHLPMIQWILTGRAGKKPI